MIDHLEQLLDPFSTPFTAPQDPLAPLRSLEDDMPTVAHLTTHDYPAVWSTVVTDREANTLS